MSNTHSNGKHADHKLAVVVPPAVLKRIEQALPDNQNIGCTGCVINGHPNVLLRCASRDILVVLLAES